MTDVSTLFELLAATPRRRVLVTLCDVDSVQVPDGLLARSAAATAPSTNGRSLPGGSTDGVRPDELQLHHNHLPKLEAEGLIEWDRDTSLVSRGPAFETVEPAVRLLATSTHALPGPFF